MLKRLTLVLLAVMASVVAGGPGRAADLALRPSLGSDEPSSSDGVDFYVHVGPAGLFTDESAKVKAFGNPVPGATVKIDPSLTASVEAGYFVTPNFAVGIAGGFPPETAIQGAGSVAAVGKLGSIVAGPVALTAQYHFTGFGRIQPYIGLGPMYLVVFSNKDAALSDLRVDPAWGVVGQVGVDVMLTEHWGAFFDVKKGYLRTDARGSMGGVPITAHVRLDPLATSGGVTYRF